MLQLKCSYDVESRRLDNGRLRFIQVKSRTADTVTVTKNEILTVLNAPDDWHLAVVLVDGDTGAAPINVQRPARQDPDFGIVSANYELDHLMLASFPSD